MTIVPIHEPFTYHDLENFSDDGKIREVIGGELFTVGPPGTYHQRLVGELLGLIWLHLRHHPVGTVFNIPIEVVFSEQDTVQPDIVFVSAEKKQIITDKRIMGAPDWVIEVLSPATRERDLTTKRKLYQRHGVVQWMIDPEARTITAWDEEGSRVYQEGKELSVSALETFSLNLSEFFAAADR